MMKDNGVMIRGVSRRVCHRHHVLAAGFLFYLNDNSISIFENRKLVRFLFKQDLANLLEKNKPETP